MARRSGWIARGCLLIVLAGGTAQTCRAQDEKPTPQQTAAIRACLDKNQEDVTEAERQCLFDLVATPCQDEEGGQSTQGMARCFQRETKIWDDLLNDAYNGLRSGLDAQQAGKLRDMQRAWIAARDATCGFYNVKIHGTIAIPEAAACLARETARRALLLRAFSGL